MHVEAEVGVGNLRFGESNDGDVACLFPQQSMTNGGYPILFVERNNKRIMANILWNR
jgi:hypothetical protein